MFKVRGRLLGISSGLRLCSTDIKVIFDGAKKKGSFFLVLKASDGRTFRSKKYKGGEEIDWAIEQ